MARKRVKSKWLSTSEICTELGITDTHLYALRDEGLLKRNEHWRNIARPQAARATYRWHKERCTIALETEPELRG
jgi:hypothetical protein